MEACDGKKEELVAGDRAPLGLRLGRLRQFGIEQLEYGVERRRRRKPAFCERHGVAGYGQYDDAVGQCG